MPEFSNARECIGPKRPSFPGACLCRQRVLSIVMLMKLLYTERERNYLSEQFQIIFKNASYRFHKAKWILLRHCYGKKTRQHTP